jgi:hypothetical protein
VACCTSNDTTDAARPVDAADSGGQPDAPSIDASMDAHVRPRETGPDSPDAVFIDAPFDPVEWEPIPDLPAECGLRRAVDPDTVLGPWTFDSCDGSYAACRRLTGSSFAGRTGWRMFVSSVLGSRAVAGTVRELREHGEVYSVITDVFVITRSGHIEVLTRSVLPVGLRGGCRVFGTALHGDTTAIYMADLTSADRDLNGARYPLFEVDASGTFVRRALMTHETISGNSPMDMAYSGELTAVRMNASNRILTIQNDGSFHFTEPAAPFDSVRVHSLPSVVGEDWLAVGIISGAAAGLFMSHMGEPSVRVRDVDAVGEVVADEADIVWLEGTALTEGIRLYDAALWRAPWRPGPIDPATAHVVRSVEDLAQLPGQPIGLGTASLPLVLGDGLVATPNQLRTTCHVIRLSDGAMATIDPPGFDCQGVDAVSAEEVAITIIEEGDTAFTTYQVWFIPVTSLTFEP